MKSFLLFAIIILFKIVDCQNDTNCPENCICDENNICIKCSESKYYGDECEYECNNINNTCVTCSKDKKCLSCLNDVYYGEQCENSCGNCPDTCTMDGKCNDQAGNCKDKLYFGEKCDQLCNEINDTCITCSRDKKCLTCLNDIYFGEQCENSCGNCPDTCTMDGKCNDQTGNCKDNLYFGEKCDQLCNEINDTCITCSRDIKCLSCLNDVYFGEQCENSCKNCPDTCTMDGKCKDQTSNCKRSLYFGEKCDQPCTKINDTCVECNRTESCLSCKNDNFYGDKCQNLCNFGCNYDTCDIEGRCNKGCLPEFFNIYCDERCDGCLNKGCDDQGYCKDFKCQHGKHGLKCDKICTCSHNSINLECGKFSSECLNCKFGYFGKNCQKKCNYKCQTELCCIFKNEGKISSALTIETNYKYLDITFNDKIYKIEIDYNCGFPLTLFEVNLNSTNCRNIKFNESFENPKGERGPSSEYNFTNYIINGILYKNSSFKINNYEIKEVDLILSKNISCRENYTGENNISGVIGLGFFNSISNAIILNEAKKKEMQNILSYSLKKDKVQFLFGTMSSSQIDYIEKLTSCEVFFGPNTDIQGKKMTCILEGIKSSKHSSALRTKESFITFSLGEKSKFILRNESNYRKYLKDEYFDGDAEETTIDDTLYFLYEKNKINKLRNFGFVFNKFYYSYEPNKFFKEYPENPKYKKFLIGLSNKTKNSEFILGKEFLEDIKFTISNEEGKIYFYAKNAEYSDEFKESASSNFRIQLEARESAAISLAIIIFINLVVFAIYFFFKKRKIKSNNYIKL